MTASVEVKIFESPKKVTKSVAKAIKKLTADSAQPRFDIALSGGTTPAKLFKILAEKYPGTIPWDRIHFWWGDERCVPPEDQNSNYKMAHELLFSRISVPEENIHRIKGENPPASEADRYAAEIEKNLNSRDNLPVFDLILLGMGEDGHTASIFPDQTELLESPKICAVAEHPETGQKRITLTGKVINSASRIFFMVTGENKALKVSEIMDNKKEATRLPAYHIEPDQGSLVWYLDEPAASKIS